MPICLMLEVNSISETYIDKKYTKVMSGLANKSVGRKHLAAKSKWSTVLARAPANQFQMKHVSKIVILIETKEK